MPFGGCQDAGGEHADGHHRHAIRLAACDDPAQVMALPAVGHRLSGAGVEDVVVDLRGIDTAALDHFTDGAGIVQRGDSGELY